MQPQQPELSQPISSGPDDLILSTSGTKRNRKAYFLVVVVLVVLAVAALIIYLVGFKPTVPATESNSYIENYKRYSNYLLYGENKTDDIGEATMWQNSGYLKKMLLSNNEQKNDYLETLEQLYDNYYISLEQRSDEIGTLSLNTKNDIDALRQYSSSNYLYTSNIVKIYLNEGPDATRLAAQENYRPLLNSESQRLKDYAEKKLEIVDSQIELYSLYKDNNCIITKEIDSECASGIMRTEVAQNLNAKIYQASKEAESMEQNIVEDVLYSSQALYKALQSKEADGATNNENK